MAKITAAKREQIPKSKVACPGNWPYSGSYPVDTPSRTASAKAYYQRGNTAKCKGGAKKICNAARRFGMFKEGYPGSAGWRSWCGRKL